MPHPLSHKYSIPISQLCLVNTDVPAGVGAPPLDTTSFMSQAATIAAISGNYRVSKKIRPIIGCTLYDFAAVISAL